MKILHCSDIHLGKRPFGAENFSKKRYEDFFKSFGELVDRAIEMKVDVFLIAGDLFDKRDLTPDILAKSEEFFVKLNSAGIKVIITEGNHDNSNRYDAVSSWLHYLEERGLAVRLNYSKSKDGKYEFKCEKIGDVNFYGLGFPGFAVDFAVAELSKILNPAEKNIVAIHTAIGGEKVALPGLIKSESLNLLKDRAIYVAGGHLHSRQVYPGVKSGERPFFFIPGSTEFWNVINERSDEKGAFIFDTDTLEYDYIHVTPRKRIREIFKIEKGTDSGEKFAEWIDTLNLTGEELVVVELEISNNLYVNSKEMERVLESKGALKGYIVLNWLRNSILDESEYATGNMTTKEIEGDLISKWREFGNSSLISHFDNLKEAQRDKNFTLFEQNFDDILEEMMADENK